MKVVKAMGWAYGTALPVSFIGIVTGNTVIPVSCKNVGITMWDSSTMKILKPQSIAKVIYGKK